MRCVRDVDRPDRFAKMPGDVFAISISLSIESAAQAPAPGERRWFVTVGAARCDLISRSTSGCASNRVTVSVDSRPASSEPEVRVGD